MIISLIEKLGDKTIVSVIKGYSFISFILQGIFVLFNFKFYTPSIREQIIQQIYRSTILIVPLFVLFGIILGSIIVVMAVLFSINYNLQEQIGKLLVSFVSNEFTPIFTTFYIFFHHGHFLFEKEDKEHFFENYLAKVLSTMVATSSMALLLAIVMLASGYVISSIFLNLDLATYQRLIINAVELDNIILLVLKSIIFGFVSVIIPSYYLDKSKQTEISSVKETVNIFALLLINIFILEILFLFIAYY